MANDNAKSKATGLKAWLDTNVPAFIKKDNDHAKERDEVFQKATAHALFHGDTSYLVLLDGKLSAATAAALNTFLRNINQKGLKLLFDGHDEQMNLVLSAVQGEDAKRNMIVNVFGRSSKEDGRAIRVGTADAAKLFRKGLADIYKSDEGIAKALADISTEAEREDRARAARDFNEFDYLKNVIGTIIRKLAPTNPEEAKRVANGINNLISDHEQKLPKKKIEELVSKNAPANRNESGKEAETNSENKSNEEVGENQEMAA